MPSIIFCPQQTDEWQRKRECGEATLPFTSAFLFSSTPPQPQVVLEVDYTSGLGRPERNLDVQLEKFINASLTIILIRGSAPKKGKFFTWGLLMDKSQCLAMASMAHRIVPNTKLVSLASRHWELLKIPMHRAAHPEIHIELAGNGAWTLEFLKAPYVFLMNYQGWGTLGLIDLTGDLQEGSPMGGFSRCSHPTEVHKNSSWAHRCELWN